MSGRNQSTELYINLSFFRSKSSVGVRCDGYFALQTKSPDIMYVSGKIRWTNVSWLVHDSKELFKRYV
ncbi:hypothetical protein PGB90_001560 [Kerria lacca]